jgi:hypothetical protein
MLSRAWGLRIVIPHSMCITCVSVCRILSKSAGNQMEHADMSLNRHELQWCCLDTNMSCNGLIFQETWHAMNVGNDCMNFTNLIRSAMKSMQQTVRSRYIAPTEDCCVALCKLGPSGLAPVSIHVRGVCRFELNL